MWRAFFLAIGIFLIIFGIECLGIHQVNLRIHESPPPGAFGMAGGQGPAVQFTPAPWIPWTFLSTGAVICLYSFTIPRRLQGK